MLLLLLFDQKLSFEALMAKWMSSFQSQACVLSSDVLLDNDNAISLITIIWSQSYEEKKN
jgi:hypothetical protein